MANSANAPVVPDLSNPEVALVRGPKGEPIACLNVTLLRLQQVTAEQLEALHLSHQLKWLLFETARHEKVQSAPLKLKLLANLFDALESEQQKLWNFEVNPALHRFFDFPGCTCPKLDNRDKLGTDLRVLEQTCPIHGDF